MTQEEEGRIIGLAYQRLKRARRSAACAQSSLLSYANHLDRIVAGIRSDKIFITHTGHFAVDGEPRDLPLLAFGSREQLAASIQKHADAQKELISAKEDYERLTG